MVSVVGLDKFLKISASKVHGARHFAWRELCVFESWIAAELNLAQEFLLEDKEKMQTRMMAALILFLGLAGCTPQRFTAVEPVPSESVSAVPPKDELPPSQPTATPMPTPAPSPTATPTLPNQKSEFFIQDKGAGQVDILVINDNSSSMAAEQAKMAQRFSSVMSSLKDLDYHIAMTTTDVDSTEFGQHGQIMPWADGKSNFLTPKTPSADSVFSRTIRRQETLDCAKTGKHCPSGKEQPLLSAILAFEQASSFNKDFFRDDTDVAVLILSDEDEMSDGVSPGVTRGTAVVDAFRRAFGNSKNLVVHGIVIKSGDLSCLLQQQAQLAKGEKSYYGTRVEELVKLTGGATYSICDADFGGSLESISKQVRTLVNSFELQNVPKGKSVKVHLDPQQDISYRIDGRKLIFEKPPVAGTRIEVVYE